MNWNLSFAPRTTSPAVRIGVIVRPPVSATSSARAEVTNGFPLAEGAARAAGEATPPISTAAINEVTVRFIEAPSQGFVGGA